jgi:hypothetical protein
MMTSKTEVQFTIENRSVDWETNLLYIPDALDLLRNENDPHRTNCQTL